MYVIGLLHVDRLDISDPLNPRVVSDERIAVDYYIEGLDGSDQVTAWLPTVPGLPARQVLEAEIRQAYPPCCLDGDTLCTLTTSSKSPGWLFAYRLTRLADNMAVFQKIGEHRPTMLENIFGRNFSQAISMANGLLYVSRGARFFHSGVNPTVDVYDTSGPHPLRLVGHFAGPDVFDVCPLPDGRAIIGGSKLWLVGPPPRRDQN